MGKKYLSYVYVTILKLGQPFYLETLSLKVYVKKSWKKLEFVSYEINLEELKISNKKKGILNSFIYNKVKLSILRASSILNCIYN